MRHKFRIWSKTKNRFLLEDDYVFICPGDGIIVSIDTVGESWFCEECVLEQWTGLIDINGQEIYEGDIIESNTPHHGNHLIEEVVFQYGMFIAAGIEYALNDLDFIKVIGNVNENPKLLEEKENE